MGESALSHHQEMQARDSVRQDRLVSVVSRTASIGSVTAALIGLAGIAAGTFLICVGASGEGLATIFAPLSVLVGVYLYNQRKRASDQNGE